MIHRILACTLLTALLTGTVRVSAQQFYTVARSTGTYTDLVNPTVIIDKPDTVGYGVSLPFSMEAFGLPLDFRQTPSNTFIFSGAFLAVAVPSQQRLCVFDAFVSQLAWRDSTSSLAYTLEGIEGEKMLKVEWKNLGMVGNPGTDFVNVQLWLSQKDNSFEVHVGPNSVTGTTAYYGYSGPSIGGFVSTYDFSTYYSTFHIRGNPANPGTDSQQPYYPMSATPSNGTIYRFSYIKPSAVTEHPDRASAAVAFQPNPCSDRSRIELPAAFDGKRPALILHDALGREALRIEHVATGDVIERGGLAAGIYYVQLSEGGHAYNGGRLVIAE